MGSAELDGVMVFRPGRRAHRPDRPAGTLRQCLLRRGAKRNRLFMAASRSLYAVYVNTQGAHHV